MDTTPIHVLLIEDDPDDAALIERYLAAPLEAVRFRLERTERLAAGCKRLSQESFDVVLLDLVLPCAAGIEGLLKVREAAPGLPVVVLTGILNEELALKAVAMGAQDYLVKGAVDGRVLARALRHAVERAKLAAKVEGLLAGDLDGKLCVDAAGLVRYANPAAEALLGRRARDLAGRPFPHPLPEAEGAHVYLSVPGDPPRVAEVRTAAIDWSGAPARLVTMRDVTELKQVERLTAEINDRMRLVDLKNEFMTTISHELRNPLTTVKTAIQSLKDGLVGPLTQQQQRFVELAHRNVERQIRIINNVLELSRLQSGKARLELRRVALPPLLEELAQAHAMAPKGPRLDWQVPEELPEVQADPDLLTQVMANLLDNALRFARERIVVKASEVDLDADGVAGLRPGEEGAAGRHGVMVSVIDDGPGLSEGQMTRLFTRFAQGARPAGQGYKGTGLGLAICKEIVSAHGGRIWAESSAGKGARFHFALPVAPVALRV